MMSISELVQTRGWRKFMAKLYGLGASVVLIGALFKLQHWSGAGTMLIIGMSTEAIIFFFSAFEPVHEEVDWSIVYPELAGVEEDPDEARERNRAKREAMKAGAGPPASGGANTNVGYSGDTGGTDTAGSNAVGNNSGGNSGGGNGQPRGGGSLTKFDEMMENADITPELFDELGEGLKRFNETAKNLNNVSNANLATEQYVNNLQAASESINLMTEAYNKSKDNLNQSIDHLSNVYQASANSIQQSEEFTSGQIKEGGKFIADKMKESGNSLASSYNQISDNLKSNIGEGTRNFNERLEELNKNLSALNAAYELELKATNEHAQTTQSIYGEMDQIMEDLKDSVEETKKYKSELSKLNQNLAELNMVYGNMLSAMSVMSNS
jgi:prefoldin subunit 5